MPEKKLNTKNLLATSLWQIFTAKLRQAFSKSEATVCHKAFILVTKRFPSPTEVWCYDKIDLVVLKKKHFKMSQRRSLQFVTVLIESLLNFVCKNSIFYTKEFFVVILIKTVFFF